jgi:hypothetical protein
MDSGTVVVRTALQTVAAGMVLGLLTFGFLVLGLEGIRTAAPGALALTLLFAVVLFVAISGAIAASSDPLNTFLIGVAVFAVSVIVASSVTFGHFAVLAFLLLVAVTFALLSMTFGVGFIALVLALFLLPLLGVALGLFAAGVGAFAISMLGLAAVVIAVLAQLQRMRLLPLPLAGLFELTNARALPAPFPFAAISRYCLHRWNGTAGGRQDVQHALAGSLDRYRHPCADDRGDGHDE